MSAVGASSGRCTYSILQIAFVKYRRSSFFVNPASWETLLSRTSTSRWTLALFSRVKKVSADFLVNPIVKILMRLRLSWRWTPHRSGRRQFVPPVGGRHRLSIPLARRTCDSHASRAGAPAEGTWHRVVLSVHRHECAGRQYQATSIEGRLRSFGDSREAPSRRTLAQSESLPLTHAAHVSDRL